MAAAMAPSGGGLSVIRAVRSYVEKLTELPGMKALLMDKETTSIVSLVESQTDIISREVFLVARVDADPTKEDVVNMMHLRAVVFIRPVEESVQALVQHLRKPRFKEYHVFFSNVVPEAMLNQLAEADEFEVVKQVQEYYGDYFAVNPDLVTLNLAHSRSLYQPEAYWQERERAIFRRNVDGIVALLLSLKKRPAIRFTRGSELSRRVSYEVGRRLKEEAGLFHFAPGSSTPLLLVLDRRDDPVTPLLMQWTYQAMVHEIVGITNNRVKLDPSGVRQDIRPENREVVLSCEQDAFFRQSMYLNFGDLGASVKTLVEEYRKKTDSNKEITSIEDMKRFVESYPEFRQLAGNVSKHVALMTELSRLVELRSMMEVSEVEQDLACNSDHSTALENVLRLLNNPRLNDEDRLRVVLLYALRYESARNQLPQMKSILQDRATTQKARNRIRAIDSLLLHCGAQVRSGDLFGQKNPFKKLASMFGSGLRGVENIYTQHRPLLVEQLELLKKGKLPVANFPYVDGGEERHEDVIVFIVGGVTYEEAMQVSAINAAGGMRVVLAGSCIHNSHSFLDDVLAIEEDPHHRD